MKTKQIFRSRYAVILGLILGLMGCGRKAVPPADEPAHVDVSHPVERVITDFVDFTARTSPIDSVEVKPRVWGYLDKMNLQEGALVKKDDVLYEIDDRPYQALLDSAVGTVAQNEASLVLAKQNNDRYRHLSTKEPGTVTAQSLNEYQSIEAQAIATLQVSKANADTARLNLEWTKVRSPIDGRVSRTQVTRGNLVQSGEQSVAATLISIVSVDPVYALFDVDEGTFLRVRELMREEKDKVQTDAAGAPVLLGLANEEGFPHVGTINFVDNQVNQKTGTMRMRGVFSNSDGILVPGLFARVRVPIGEPRKTLLVTDRAFDADQGQKVVFVVDDKNQVSSRPVKLGSLHDGLRVVEQGLKPGEQVVVNGVQQVRPGSTVEPKLVDMPVSADRRPAGATNPKPPKS